MSAPRIAIDTGTGTSTSTGTGTGDCKLPQDREDSLITHDLIYCIGIPDPDPEADAGPLLVWAGPQGVRCVP